MRPELGTKPRVYYRNLWRYSKCFIGGSVSAEANGVVDCVEGATVRLMRNGQQVAELQSDNYGDFKFDKLDENSGAYVVEIEAARPQEEDASRPSSASASISARSGCKLVPSFRVAQRHGRACPGHPRLCILGFSKQDVDARHERRA